MLVSSKPVNVWKPRIDFACSNIILYDTYTLLSNTFYTYTFQQVNFDFVLNMLVSSKPVNVWKPRIDFAFWGPLISNYSCILISRSF